MFRLNHNFRDSSAEISWTGNDLWGDFVMHLLLACAVPVCGEWLEENYSRMVWVCVPYKVNHSWIKEIDKLVHISSYKLNWED